jgi:hypothetical protein
LHKKIDLEVVMLRNIWLALLFQEQLAMRKGKQQLPGIRVKEH